MRNEGSCAVVWAFFSTALLWTGMKTERPSYLSLLFTACITKSLKAELPEVHLSTCVWAHTGCARWGSLNRPARNLFAVRSRFPDSSLFSRLRSVERSLLSVLCLLTSLQFAESQLGLGKQGRRTLRPTAALSKGHRPLCMSTHSWDSGMPLFQMHLLNFE